MEVLPEYHGGLEEMTIVVAALVASFWRACHEVRMYVPMYRPRVEPA